MSETTERLRDLARYAEAELPPGIAARYRSPRHRGAMVEIGRILSAVGMTWQALHRATAGERYYERAELLALVDRIERAQPWAQGSSAPDFMATLRDLAKHYPQVRLSERQADWLDVLIEDTETWEAKRSRFTVIEGGA